MRLKPIKSNMNEIVLGERTILFSYETPVAFYQVGEGFFKTEKKWSVTTSKHINQWVKMRGGTVEKVREVPQETIDNLVKR